MKPYTVDNDHRELKRLIKWAELEIDAQIGSLWVLREELSWQDKQKVEDVINELDNISHALMAVNI